MATAYTDADCQIHLQDTGTSYESSPPGLKAVGFELTDLADDGDTLAITLSKVGLTTVWDVWQFTHSTTDDVIIREEGATDVTAGVLTITVGGATDNKKRVYIVWGEA